MDRPRLLAFDLDKTIVTDEHFLPIRIERAIREARHRGHLVTVLTGRPLEAAKPFLEQLEIEGPHSVNHGALVFGSKDTVLRQRRIAAEDTLAVLSPYLDVPELDFSCIIDDVLFVRDPNDDRWAWAHTRNRQVRRFDPDRVQDADKIVFAANGLTERVELEIAERHPELITYLWGDGFLEITAPDADKGGALRLIAEHLGVPREATVAFGDGLNDVTMIGWAGHGVAVGPHAHPDVLARAAEHIASPEEGGVADWLERNLVGPVEPPTVPANRG